MFKKTELHENIKIEGIYTLHFFDYGKGFHFDGERHDFWEMVYVDMGEVTVRAEGKTHFLKKGQVIFHKPNEYHAIWVDDSFASAVIITFATSSGDMSFFEGRILSINAKQKKCIEEILEEGKIAFAEPLDILYQTEISLLPDAPFGVRQMIKINLEQMLIDMIRCDKKAMPSGELPEQKAGERRGRPSEEQVVEQVIKILEEQLYRHITLDEIASRVGFSKSYIKTLFRRNKDTSVMQMYNKMKIDYAKKLISEQKYFITEISEMAGFNSIHYFSRTFKKMTGMTPSSYSQSVRKKALL